MHREHHGKSPPPLPQPFGVPEQRCLHKYCSQQLDEHTSPFFGAERDAMDSHLGGLLHQVLLTSLGDFQLSTPAQQKWNKRRLVGILVSLVNFCYLCLQKSGSCRQFAALNTLNKARKIFMFYGQPPFHLADNRCRAGEFGG